MSEAYKNSIARILREPNKQPIGAGVLVGLRQVLTCAHVVNSALGRPLDAKESPSADSRVTLDFPLPAPGVFLTAKVVKWEGPRADAGGDMALLELESPPPANTTPAQFTNPGEVWGHSFRAFGFPDHHMQGRDASGVLRGRNAIQRLMMEQSESAQNFALPGFSGTGVWDETLGALIGIIVLGEYGQQMSAFLIPADQVKAFWPDLPLTPMQEYGAPKPTEFKYHVFISYTRSDEAWVENTLVPRLENAGLKVFVEFRDIQPGASRVDEIQRVVVESAKTLVILTPDYLNDEWTVFGNVMAKMLDPAARQRRLIPLMKSWCEPPLYIAHLVPVDFTRSEPDRQQIAWTQLLTALGAQVVEEKKPEVSTPPANWFLAHPYPMPPNFTGRVAERTQLTRWLENDPQHAALVIRALGGFGKSALTWHWLTHDVDAKHWPRVVWWSFYETQASFQSFVEQTLEYLFPQGVPHFGSGVHPNQLNPRQQVQILLGVLAQPGTLLILDGFERELRAYSGLSAAYQGDEPQLSDPQYPISNIPSQLHQRDCISPLAEHFLRAVASLPNLQSKVLLTTRLRPRPLEGHGGVLLAGCDEMDLTALHPDDAVAFFRAQGIRGGRAEIQTACARYGNHPLSLRLLAGLVVDDLQQPGDIAAANRLDVSGDQKQRQHHVLEAAYNTLTPTQQSLLSRIACFRGPVGYDAIKAIESHGRGAAGNRPGKRSEKLPLRPYDDDDDDHREFDQNLHTLITRGLLHHDLTKNTYDLHPIVRRYAYDRLTGDARTAAHSGLRDYFEAVPKPDKVQRLEDLAPLIELYHHTVQAGQLDEATELMRDRLIPNPLYFQFGAYQLCIELLRGLFHDGEEKLPRLNTPRNQSWTCNALANSYSLIGQPAKALPLFKLCASIDEKQSDKLNLAINLGNLADDQLKIGALREAEANNRRRIILCREIEDDFNEAIGHDELGRVLAYTVRWGEAEEEMRMALEMFEKQSDVQGQCIVWTYRALRALMMLRDPSYQTSEVERSGMYTHTLSPETSGVLTREALAAARRALELADETARTRYPVERNYIHAHWLLGAAYRVNGDLENADSHLTDALTRCRGINLIEMEADILIDLARLRRDEGNPEEALRLLNEALLITERSGYVLQGADVHLLLAELALARGERKEALTHAREARRLATCDGPPDYTYKVAYEEAGRMLDGMKDEG